MIRAELRLAGALAAERGEAMAKAARTRRLPADIRVEVGADSFVATLDARIVDGKATALQGFDHVDAHGDGDAPVIERMLHLIKGAFEEGIRPYDHRTFGLWAGTFRRGG